MRNLKVYDKNQEETLKNIYNAKRATVKVEDNEYKVKILVHNRYNEIIEKYKYYENKKMNLEKIEKMSFNEQEKKALIHCYENSTTELNKLKVSIRTNQPNELTSICAYCGINYPVTYDHYIPKSEYPEYSVYSPNLVPCCDECNRKKGDNWKGDDGERIFLNFYYDTVIDEEIIYSRVIIQDGVPKITFEFVTDNYGTKCERLKNGIITKNHINKLNLLERYRDSCTSYIEEIKNSLKAHKKWDKSEIFKFLDDERNGIIETYGINHWKSVTLKGMYNSKDFIDFCSQKST